MEEYQQLFERYYPEICRQLAYVTGDRTSAEDLAQETFLKLYATPPRHRNNLVGWLRKVAVNLAYKHIQREQNRQKRELRTVSEWVHTTDVDQFWRRHEVKQVRSVLDKLAERDRICLILRFSGYSYAEVARAIGVEASSVGTILARARAKFRDEFNRQEGGA
ncbi:MAG: RNA polymerase sigma factor SigX [Bacillota bacterium]